MSSSTLPVTRPECDGAAQTQALINLTDLGEQVQSAPNRLCNERNSLESRRRGGGVSRMRAPMRPGRSSSGTDLSTLGHHAVQRGIAGTAPRRSSHRGRQARAVHAAVRGLCHRSIAGPRHHPNGTGFLGRSWDAVRSIMQRAGERDVPCAARIIYLFCRNTARTPQIGRDQNDLAKGQDDFTVMTDLDASRVLDAAADRTQPGRRPKTCCKPCRPRSVLPSRPSSPTCGRPRSRRSPPKCLKPTWFTTNSTSPSAAVNGWTRSADMKTTPCRPSTLPSVTRRAPRCGSVVARWRRLARRSRPHLWKWGATNDSAEAPV